MRTRTPITSTNGWYKVERPSSRDTLGNIRWTIEDENHWEIAMGGLDAISLGQWAIWEAVYGPVDEDGYPARVWIPSPVRLTRRSSPIGRRTTTSTT